MNLQNSLNEILSNWVTASKQTFAQHSLANFIRHTFKSVVETIAHDVEPEFEVTGSAGQGNWADVPWLSIRNPAFSSSTQNGVYPVYLFRADGSGVYLSLNQGTTELEKQLGKSQATVFIDTVRKAVLNVIDAKGWSQDSISLHANTSRGKSYEPANIISKYYAAGDLPTNEQLEADLRQMLTLYQLITPEMISITEFQQGHRLLSDVESPQLEVTAAVDQGRLRLPRNLVLLAGISGTGKTRFVREQAKNNHLFPNNYCLVPVRPDWVEPSDLLGYISRLTADNQPEYVATDVLKFIAAAWKQIADSGLNPRIATSEYGAQQLEVVGNRSNFRRIPPYWLCLDEMNLAPVEQYFADYLSIAETQEWQWRDDDFTYRCDALLKNNETFNDSLRARLGLAAQKYNELWDSFCAFGIPIPFNLMVIGTVNMDESTHGFSRKVLDRALSIDFGEFFPNDFELFFKNESKNIALTYPIISHVDINQLSTSIDPAGEKSISFLAEINEVLKTTPFELAYRSLNELLITVANFNPENEVQLQAVWDDFVMTKVLPRIEGDTDRLAITQRTNIGNSVLVELSEVLQRQLLDIWEAPNRPDWYRLQSNDQNEIISCRSRFKIQWMQSRLQSNGFTSFWP